jgi:hypothetical protein
MNYLKVFRRELKAIIEGGNMNAAVDFCRRNDFRRHFPDNPQIPGNRTTIPPPRVLHPFRNHSMA